MLQDNSAEIIYLLLHHKIASTERNEKIYLFFTTDRFLLIRGHMALLQ